MNNMIKDKAATAMFWLAALLVLLILATLTAYIIYHGWLAVDWQLLTNAPRDTGPGGGIGPLIFNSFYILVLTMIISVPVGLLGGIYLAEYAGQNPLAEGVRVAIETLTALPSIVVGLLGLLVLVNMTGWGYSLLSGALALAVFNLPFLVRVTEESIRSVPREQAWGALALGATKWQTIRGVVLPGALPAILTGVLLASGRVLGEAAVLLYTAGLVGPGIDFNNWNIMSPTSPLNPFRPAETLAVHIWRVNTEGVIPDLRRVADGSTAVLVLVVLAFNIGARWLGRLILRRMTAV